MGEYVLVHTLPRFTEICIFIIILRISEFLRPIQFSASVTEQQELRCTYFTTKIFPVSFSPFKFQPELNEMVFRIKYLPKGVPWNYEHIFPFLFSLINEQNFILFWKDTIVFPLSTCSPLFSSNNIVSVQCW